MVLLNLRFLTCLFWFRVYGLVFKGLGFTGLVFSERSPPRQAGPVSFMDYSQYTGKGPGEKGFRVAGSFGFRRGGLHSCHFGAEDRGTFTIQSFCK